MANLNRPAISTGPLVAADLHRVTLVCPPCTGLCNQGRDCHPQAAEACTEIGADPDPYDGTQVFRGLFSAVAITAILAGLVLALT